MHVLILGKNTTKSEKYSNIIKRWGSGDTVEPDIRHVSDINSFLHYLEIYAKGEDDFFAARIGTEESAFENYMVKAGKSQRVLLNSKGKTVIIKEEEVVYCERQGRITYVHCRGGTFEIPTKLSVFAEQLNPGNFIRCHNSFIVNFDAVQEFTRNGFVLTKDVKIPISKHRITETREKFFKWMNGLPENP